MKLERGLVQGMRSLGVALVLVGVLLATTIVGVLPDAPPRNGYITYVRGTDIFVAGGDRPPDTLLASMNTDPGKWCCVLSWSPDGKRLLIGSLNAIDVIDVDGSNRRTVVTGLRVASDLTWSPDGSKVAFCLVVQGEPQLFVANPDAGSARQLSTDLVAVDHFAWSPDGRSIALSGWKVDGRTNALFVMAAAGGPSTLIAENVLPGSHLADWGPPAWSPDGTTIAFDLWTSDPARFALYSLRVDTPGHARRILSQDGVNPIFPTWSSDGRRLTFLDWRTPSVRTDLYAVNADGTGLRLLAEDASQYHTRSPDGRLIAFGRGRTADRSFGYLTSFRELWTVDVDSGALTFVTNKGVTGGISWQPTFR